MVSEVSAIEVASTTLRLPAGAGRTDQFHSLLVVSGKTSDEIKLAAETLTGMTIPFPGTDEMTAFEFTLPEITLYGGRLVLTADKDYAFKMLNLATHTFEGFNPAPMNLIFRLPVDFLIKQNQYAVVSLNFTYGAGMRPDSAIGQRSARSCQASAQARICGTVNSCDRGDFGRFCIRRICCSSQEPPPFALLIPISLQTQA